MHEMILLYSPFHTRHFTLVSRQQKVNSWKSLQTSRFLCHSHKQIDQKCIIHCLPEAIQYSSFIFLCFQKVSHPIRDQKQKLLCFPLRHRLEWSRGLLKPLLGVGGGCSPPCDSSHSKIRVLPLNRKRQVEWF